MKSTRIPASFYDGLFADFKFYQHRILQIGVDNAEDTTVVIVPFKSITAQDVAHAVYSVQEERVIAISCRYWHSEEAGHSLVTIKLPAIFSSVWKSPLPIREHKKYFGVRDFLIWIASDKFQIWAELDHKPLKQKAFRYDHFNFRFIDGPDFSFHHYLN